MGLIIDVQLQFELNTFRYQLTIEVGEIVGVVGPSGGGKSTLLHLIAGFIQPDSGLLSFNDQNLLSLTASQRPVSLVFQAHNLFPHLSVLDNVLLGIDPQLSRHAHHQQAALGALEQVGLTGMAQRKPEQLSGGERQRVALARALLRQRPLLLLDEPLAALGPAQRHEMLLLMQQLRDQHGLTLLLVSHQPNEIATICDRLIFVADGCISWQGSPSALTHSALPQVVIDYLGV